MLVIGAISFPLLLDREVGAAVALSTSVRLFVRNPVMMALWGLIVAALLLLGSLPFFIGLAVGDAGARPRHLASLSQGDRRAAVARARKFRERRIVRRYAADFPASLFR